MKILVTTDDGELLDSTVCTVEEFKDAQKHGLLARVLIESLNVGDGGIRPVPDAEVVRD